MVAEPERGGPVRLAVLVGSPRRASCALVAREVAAGASQAGVEASCLYLDGYLIGGCTGCGACSATGRCVLETEEGRPDRPGFAALREELLHADALALVAPVYFGGPPSQLKAAFDRFQPLWVQRYLLGTRPALSPAARKPLDLFVLGGGGDPFGYDALVACARSALRMADFELREVRDLVGFEAWPGGQRELLLQARAWGAELARAALAAPRPTIRRPDED